MAGYESETRTGNVLVSQLRVQISASASCQRRMLDTPDLSRSAPATAAVSRSPCRVSEPSKSASPITISFARSNCSTRQSNPPLVRLSITPSGSSEANAARATARLFPPAHQCQLGIARQASMTGWDRSGKRTGAAAARPRPSNDFERPEAFVHAGSYRATLSRGCQSKDVHWGRADRLERL
jgi:hypothetical protein